MRTDNWIRRSLLTSIFVLVLAAPASGALAAPSVRAVPVATGLASPVGFTFTPKGVLVYVERNSGWVRFRNLATDFDRRFFRVSNVNAVGERGALGVALHPRWPARPFVYVYATRQTGSGLRNQVIRIRAEANRAIGWRVLLSIPAGPASNHNGGRILFGPDGKLYVAVGDGGLNPGLAQRLGSLKGKILRINPDGSVPKTNPFGSRVWAFGIRNSIGMAFDPRTGLLWETDNGPSCNDEVNLIRKGGNHAWGANQDCFSGSSPGNTNNSGPAPRRLPKAWFVTPIGITGAVFCDRCGLGKSLDGDLLVGAVNDGRIRRFNLKSARNGISSGPTVILDRPAPVLSFEAGSDRRLYLSDFAGVYRLARA
jgi:glucose/arabinose dehydrogenase